MEEQDALAVIRAALDAGINFLDDARYNDRTGHAPMKTGYSEVLFGRLLRAGGWKREKLIIANKLWHEFYPEQSPKEELESSLSRLQMDYLDLVYCEDPPAAMPMLEMIQQVDELIQEGKLRAWGVLNWSTEKIQEAVILASANGLPPPCAAQLPYSLLARSPVEDGGTRTLFQSANIGVVASYSLYGGLLSGKYNTAGAIQGRFKPDQIQSLRDNGLIHKVKQVARIAHELGCTPAQLALAYCLKNEQVASVLFGATIVSQVHENTQAFEVLPHLTPEVMNRLDNLL
jgi:aryl-alcohol dehydrogenase-like predicted oxidoreductase